MRFSTVLTTSLAAIGVIALSTSYSLYTTVVTYETTLYSTFTSVSCPEVLSTSVATHGDTVDTIIFINTCNPAYTDYTLGVATTTVTNTNTHTLTETVTEDLIPSSEIVWD